MSDQGNHPGQNRPPSASTGPTEMFQAMLAEYQSLRQESLGAIGHRMTVMSFTFAALSVVIGGLLTRQVSDLLAGLLALLFVPQMAKAGLLIWLGEYRRSQRAGRWVAALESKINNIADGDAMGWETHLSSKSLHMSYPYVAVVALVMGIGYTGDALGGYFVYLELDRNWSQCAAIALIIVVAVVVVAAEVGFLRFFQSRWRACRTG
jgi:hypothetical protein